MPAQDTPASQRPYWASPEELAQLAEWVESGYAVKLRTDAGLSIVDIAERVEAGRASVWRWEQGKSRPRGRFALAYLRVLRRLEADLAKTEETPDDRNL